MTKPRLKPHYELVPSRRWVIVWQGETPEDKARTRTTWQIPVGKVWDDLRQKLRDGVWPERGQVTQVLRTRKYHSAYGHQATRILNLLSRYPNIYRVSNP